ncbi:unnamed protein product [Mycetohabitans rhizoxinica HKI 454]|uniref:Uncharacterized protein n=1 Tax=Mycetohabitans rhizoxinica (strain DSM 19002 / CIP 109453 / HKI 454) TaxID=882378 RepID=E5AMM5_MYCRK|nr:unnamed protein product [Mycetohabitans rhizoxinica HKI 454]
MDRVNHLLDRRAQTGNEDRHPMIDAHAHVALQTSVGLMHDLIDRDRADHRVRMLGTVLDQRLLDLREPCVEQFRRPRIERGKGSDDARLALREHQFRVAHDEHRRRYNRQRQTLQ